MKKKSLVKVLIVVFPVGLMVMGVASLFLYEHRRLDKQTEHPMSQAVTQKGMISYYKKLDDFMSPRGLSSESERKNLIRTTSFIEGTLAPVNTGMVVRSEKVLTRDGRIWKSYSVEFDGVDTSKVQTISINYCEDDNVELLMGLVLGEALPRVQLKNPVKLIFTPECGGDVFKEITAQAKLRGAGLSLNYGGVDWEFVEEELLNKIDLLKYEKH